MTDTLCVAIFKCSENTFQGGGRFIVDGELVIVSQRARQGPHPLEGLTQGGQLQQLACRVGLVSSGIGCMQDSRGAEGRGWTRKEEQQESLTVDLHHRSDRPAELLCLLSK